MNHRWAGWARIVNRKHARAAALGGAAVGSVAALAVLGAACSGSPAAPGEPTQEAREEVNYCGGQYCETGESCCSTSSGPKCMTWDECCVTQGKHVCGRSCTDVETDPKNCGSCGVVCQGICSNGACVPVEVQSFRLSLERKDLSVAAGPRYVIASDESNFNVLDRYSFFGQVTDTELSPTTLTSSDMITGAQNLFRNFLFDNTTDNINTNLWAGSSPVVRCDPQNPIATPDPTHQPPGIVMKSDAWWPTGTCIDEVYDVRTTYEPVKQRFWIIAAARNRVARDSCDVAASTDKTTCAAFNSLALRFSFVAVSKDSDPHHGFWKYIVANDYDDSPEQGVHNDYAIFGHTHEGPVHIFDANAMETGPSLPPELKVGGKVLQSGVDFIGARVRVAKHHEGATTVTYIVSAAQSPYTNDLWIYALVSPHPSGAATLIGPAHYADPGGRPMYMHDAAFANGNLYLTNSTPATGAVAVWRVPISQDDVQNQREIPAANASTWALSTPGQAADLTTVDVTDADDVVVGWRSLNPSTSPSLAKYAILYHGETTFRSSKNEVNITGTSGASFGPDFVSSARDSYDTSSVWTAIPDENGFLLTNIHP